MGKNIQVNRLKILNLSMLIDPILLFCIAFIMKKHLAYQPSPEFYEINTTMRYVQYFLYLSGLAVFFFIDGIVSFIKKRLPKDEHISPIKHNLISMALLDYISVSGFVGFLISGNITWVAVFCAISFFSRFRFLPTRKNLSRYHSNQG